MEFIEKDKMDYTLTYKNINSIFIQTKDIEKVESLKLVIGGCLILTISNNWLNYLKEKQINPEYTDISSKPIAIPAYSKLFENSKLNFN